MENFWKEYFAAQRELIAAVEKGDGKAQGHAMVKLDRIVTEGRAAEFAAGQASGKAICGAPALVG
jgi:hypothetical protein